MRGFLGQLRIKCIETWAITQKLLMLRMGQNCLMLC